MHNEHTLDCSQTGFNYSKMVDDLFIVDCQNIYIKIYTVLSIPIAFPLPYLNIKCITVGEYTTTEPYVRLSYRIEQCLA